MKIDRLSRVQGGLLGLLVGDAMGVPYEFKSVDELPPPDLIDMVPPPGYVRSHPGVPPGTWSDDGAQALCLWASLNECGRLDLSDFGSRLVRWLDEGYMAVDGKVFDVGIASRQAIANLRRGVPPEQSGLSDENSNGNGSLMRVLPLALWHQGSDEELVRLAMLSSIPTHAHLRSQLCCALYCLWARALLEGELDGWEQAVSKMRSLFAVGTSERAELEDHILSFPESKCRGTGYVVDCLHSARMAMREPDYRSVVIRAIQFGNDTDTTACVAGGLAGVRQRADGAPAALIAHMRQIGNSTRTSFPVLFENLRLTATV